MLQIRFPWQQLLFVFALIVVSVYFGFVTYQQLVLEDRGSLNAHVEFARNMMNGEPLKDNRTLDVVPHVGYFYSLIALTKLGFSLEEAAIIILTLAHLAAFVITYLLYQRCLENSLPKSLLLVSAFLSLVIAGIYLPFVDRLPYFGPYSPNTHHNSTVILLKPIATLAFFMLVSEFEREKRRLTWLIAGSIVFALSIVVKPTFGLVFIPALGLWLLFRPRFRENVLHGLIVVLPAIGIILLQYYFYYEAAEHRRGVDIAAFVNWARVSSNIPLSFLQAIVFPLLLTAMRRTKLKFHAFMIVAWLMLFVGTGQFIFLTETLRGNVLESGNWVGGYLMGLSLLYTVSILEFLVWLKEYPQLSRQQRILFWLCLLLIVVHVVSGFFYDYRLLTIGKAS